MQNFEFYNPTRILFGKGMIARLDEQLSPEARVLVLYGGASAERSARWLKFGQRWGTALSVSLAVLKPTLHMKPL